MRRLSGDRLRQRNGLGVVNDLDLGRVYEEERHHHGEDVDEGNEIELGVGPVAQMVLGHAARPIGHAHCDTCASGGASPMEMSGKSSACTVCRPSLVSKTRM